MKRTLTADPDSFWTTYSLKTPVAEGNHSVGGYLVSIWAQTQDAVGFAKDWLTTTYAQSNSAEIRVVVKSVVDHAEHRGVPLACRILGKE
jgi:hypothetical protein